MRVLLVGATGAIGMAVNKALAGRSHDVIAAHRSSPDYPIDLTRPETIQAVVDRMGTLDAIACTAGTTPFGSWEDMNRDAWLAGINSKLLGQVELVRRGTGVLRPGGSFTLISGILAREPIPTGSVAAAVNGALEAWVRASAGELWGRYRINVVSPTVLTESLPKYADAFPGFPAVDAAAVGQAYVRSVETMETGQVYAL
jgi:NAD(P)-dependent dehydrogenase (short-subunit alcohol dehydrogenase family)